MWASEENLFPRDMGRWAGKIPGRSRKPHLSQPSLGLPCSRGTDPIQWEKEELRASPRGEVWALWGAVFAENLETVGPLSFTNPGNAMEQGGKVGVGKVGGSA